MFYVLDRTYLYAVVITLFGALVLEEQSLAQWLKRFAETEFFVRLWLHRPRVFKARDLLNRSGLAY